MSDSGDPVHHWMTSEKFGELVQARKQAFQEKGGLGVPVSTTLLANYLGTQAKAATALERAATLVWQAHVSSQGSMRVSKNESVLFHERDLAIFKEMLDRGEISTLAQKQTDFWSTAKRQKHGETSEKGGGCKEGPMTGTDLQEHREACEKGGKSKEGPMTGTDLEEHRALMAQGYTEKHRLMMQLANGKEGQENLWKCSDSNHGTAVLYHFRADNEPTIDGMRQFEKCLLDDQDGFVPGKLTTAGAEAHNALKRMRANADRDNASRERKKNRQGK